MAPGSPTRVGEFEYHVGGCSRNRPTVRTGRYLACRKPRQYTLSGALEHLKGGVAHFMVKNGEKVNEICRFGF